jgi:hypothetical protein
VVSKTLLTAVLIFSSGSFLGCIIILGFINRVIGCLSDHAFNDRIVITGKAQVSKALDAYVLTFVVSALQGKTAVFADRFIHSDSYKWGKDRA